MHETFFIFILLMAHDAVKEHQGMDWMENVNRKNERGYMEFCQKDT